MMMRGANIVIECLLEQGVDTVFGYPGGTVSVVYDALYDYEDRIKHVLSSHEQHAAHAADAYARATGKTGVVLATSGPGATNLVTGIANAYMDSVPLVAITANVATNDDRQGFVSGDRYHRRYDAHHKIQFLHQAHRRHRPHHPPRLRDSGKRQAGAGAGRYPQGSDHPLHRIYAVKNLLRIKKSPKAAGGQRGIHKNGAKNDTGSEKPRHLCGRRRYSLQCIGGVERICTEEYRRRFAEHHGPHGL